MYLEDQLTGATGLPHLEGTRGTPCPLSARLRLPLAAPGVKQMVPSIKISHQATGWSAGVRSGLERADGG